MPQHALQEVLAISGATGSAGNNCSRPQAASRRRCGLRHSTPVLTELVLAVFIVQSSASEGLVAMIATCSASHLGLTSETSTHLGGHLQGPALPDLDHTSLKRDCW